MSARALVFSSVEALLSALTSGLVPARVQAQPARAWTGEDQGVVVLPRRPLGRAALRNLHAAGVRSAEAAPGDKPVREVPVWPALIPPRRARKGDALEGRTVIFVLDSEEASRGLLDLTAELLRLGCDRCAYQLVTGPQRTIALVRAFDPPYYTVAACSEPGARCRVFVPAHGHKARTWIELGHEHPLAGAIEPAEGQLCLIAGDGAWLTCPDGPWRDMFELVSISLPATGPALVPAPPPDKLAVRLRLAPASRAEPPSLWVLIGAGSAAHGGAAHGPSPLDQVEALVTSLPESLLSRLSFAVLGPARDPLVVLRARPGRAGPPALDVSGAALVPLPGLPNLYVPAGANIEPPLRRDTLRALLAPEDERIYWLTPGDHHDVVVSSVPERAFAPLCDWVEYLVHQSAEALAPWVRSVTFELESFQSTGREWSEAEEPARVAERERPPRVAPRPDREARADTDAPAAITAAEPQAPGSEPAAPEPPAPRPASRAELALAELERAFLEADAAADAPARGAMWLDMARLLRELDRGRDAALCFVRAMWELDAAGAAPILDEWAKAEARALDTQGASLLWLPLEHASAPTPDELRAVAVQWIAAAGAAGAGVTAGSDAAAGTADASAAAGEGQALMRVQQWFDAHDRTLDVRTLWLVRGALAARVGGDALGMARARDRVLHSLSRGLSLTRDVPAFLRFLGHPGGGDSMALERLADRVESLLTLFDETRRQRSAVEAPTALTRAYVSLVVACGLARLGRAERAERLRDQAISALDLDDPVHGFLARAYAARIDQALDGQPPETPLPEPVLARLAALEDGGGRDHQLSRYKVDRLRQASSILAPHERIDAMHGFLRRFLDAGDEELAALLRLGPAELGDELVRRLDQALAADAAVRPRRLEALMDAFPMLPDAQAIPGLRRILRAAGDVAPAARALLLEKALMLAGYFGREELAADVAERLNTLVAELAADQAEALAPELGACLRSLRRVGLRDHAARLVDALLPRLGGDGARALEARLHLAAGLLHLGLHEQAAPVLARARQVLAGAELRVVDQRLRLVRALALALAELPRDQALDGLASLSAQLAGITDNYNTNSHFCLSVIAFMESLVLGHARSDLALGELGRRWLDDDEHLVRRRIHREFGAHA